MKEEKNTQSLENKVLKQLILDVGKCFIPYIGDKAFHKQVNEFKEESRGQKEANFLRCFITGMEPIFYIAKYGIFYLVGKNLF